MPLYSYRCKRCKLVEEHVVSYANRDHSFKHDGCGGQFERDPGLECPTIGPNPYVMKAVLRGGDHITGHFGKEAPRRRKKS